MAHVNAPRRPGQYRLLWDIEEEHRRWFSSEPGGTLYVTRATVSGPDDGQPQSLQLVALPRKADRPGRLVLWRAGARMLAAHPLRGVGPDNFRLVYGEYAGLLNPDPRVHSNNMYLELLVGGGALVALPLIWFLWRSVRTFRNLVGMRQVAEISTLSAGVVAAGVAIALHGFVDSFLSFTATYVLIAITLGLASACEKLGTPHANRV
jgi:O-antigen ligase